MRTFVLAVLQMFLALGLAQSISAQTPSVTMTSIALPTNGTTTLATVLEKGTDDMLYVGMQDWLWIVDPSTTPRTVVKRIAITGTSPYITTPRSICFHPTLGVVVSLGANIGTGGVTYGDLSFITLINPATGAVR